MASRGGADCGPVSDLTDTEGGRGALYAALRTWQAVARRFYAAPSDETAAVIVVPEEYVDTFAAIPPALNPAPGPSEVVLVHGGVLHYAEGAHLAILSRAAVGGIRGYPLIVGLALGDVTSYAGDMRYVGFDPLDTPTDAV